MIFSDLLGPERKKRRFECRISPAYLSPKPLPLSEEAFGVSLSLNSAKKSAFRERFGLFTPKRDTVAGLKAFASIEALPDTVDAAFIGVNRHATVEAVRALSARNCGGAVCFASGFLEAENEAEDGRDLQNDLLSSAGEMPIIGPNCYGFINYLDRAALWPDQHGGISVDRGVALITQSSNMAINLTMQKRGLPLSYVATAGNQAQLGIADLGRPFWKTRASQRWACTSKVSETSPPWKSSRVWPRPNRRALLR